jgi:hypothetical protein
MHYHYHFEFFPKGLEVRWDHNSNQVRQSIPFTQIITVRLDYNYDDKIWSLFLLLQDGVKYTYTFKSCGDAEKVYLDIQAALLQ